MKKLSITLLSALLLAAVVGGQTMTPLEKPEAPPAADPGPQVDAAPAGEAVPTEQPAIDLLLWLDDSGEANMSRDPQPDAELLRMPVPPPSYCPDCIQCTSDLQCGRDDHGILLGTCAAVGNSYCGYKPYRTCICY